MKGEARWPGFLYQVGQSVGVVAAAGIALLTLADVGLRYLFNRPIFGGAEITNMFLALLVGAGLIVVAAMRSHISVDIFEGLLVRRFPAGYPRWVRAWNLIGTLALAALLVRHAWHTIDFGELTAVLEFPIGWVYAVVALMVIASFAVFLSGWQVSLSGDDESDGGARGAAHARGGE